MAGFTDYFDLLSSFLTEKKDLIAVLIVVLAVTALVTNPNLFKTAPTPTPTPHPAVQQANAGVSPTPNQAAQTAAEIAAITKKLADALSKVAKNRVSYDADTGKIITSPGFNSIDLVADSVLPGDAAPLELATKSNCEILIQQTPSEDSNCFSYDAGAGRFSFKSSEFGGSCGEGVYGNDLTPGNASTELVFTASCNMKASKKIPVTLQTRQADSVHASPNELTEGDASLKLLYLVNEKQVGSRVLALTKNGGSGDGSGGGSSEDFDDFSQETMFDAPGAVAIGWNGPDSVALTDNPGGSFDAEKAVTVKTWDYVQQTSVFPLRGDEGHRITTKEECGDYACCESNWCNAEAFSKAFEYFSAAAMKTGTLTAFRRAVQTGVGQPLRYLTGEPFQFVAVAQLVEGGRQALESNGIKIEDYPVESADSTDSVESPESPDYVESEPSVNDYCKQEWPAVYELTASSFDGTHWTYTAKIARFKTNEFDAGQPLCGYVHGDSNELKITRYSTIASNEQANDAHSEIVSKESGFTPMPVSAGGVFASFGEDFDKACKKASTKFSDKRGLTAVAVSHAQAVCCGCTVPDAETVAAAQQEYLACMDSPSETQSCAADFQSKIQDAIASVKEKQAVACAPCPPEGQPCDPECCSCAASCLPALSSVSRALNTEKQAGKACDDLHGHYIDYPGILPPRASRANCYARGDTDTPAPTDGSCHLTCEPKIGFAQTATFGDQALEVTHAGLTGVCETQTPESVKSAAGIVEDGSPRILPALNNNHFILEEDAIAVFGTCRSEVTQGTETEATEDVCVTPLADTTDLNLNYAPQFVAKEDVLQEAKQYRPELAAKLEKAQALENEKQKTVVQNAAELELVREDARLKLGEADYSVFGASSNVAKTDSEEYS